MRYYEIAPIKIFRSNSDVFTYAYSENIDAGTIVEIPVGKSKTIGIVLKKVAKPDFTTKIVERIIENKPLPNHLLELSLWMKNYYQTPLAKILNSVLPSGISKKRRVPKNGEHEISRTKRRTNFLLNEQQTDAIDKLDKVASGTVLLHGITGSGKTEVYINQAEKIINSGKSVILLVPEIALTSQLVMNFAKNFNDIKILHSRMTESEKHISWQKILQCQNPQIVIGARSALFAPVQNLGLIIIDEAHEPSFKQEQTPKYSALRASSFLANKLGIKAIFGSATPLIEDYFLAERISTKQKPTIVEMDKLAKKEARPPKINLIDLTKKSNLTKHRFFSNLLLKRMEDSLSQNKQVLIYHNRRGSASVTMCHNCGWMALCPHCFLPLTLHIDKNILICHTCGHKEKIPTACPDCNEAEIIHKGVGTKMIEDELKKLFPNKVIARFDADSDKNSTINKLYKQIVDGEIDIIVGTQVIAKGLDLPKLQTVGVIQADAGLALPDFTSSERNFQLLAQVIGRVGRHASDTNVVIQSYQPNSPSVKFGIKQDYKNFYKYEIENRKKANFPPFVFLLKLTCVYKTEKSAINNAQKEAKNIREKYKDIQILGPTPSFYERVGDTYRWQIIVKSKKRGALLEIAKELSLKPHWRVDIDPPSLL